jgi:hypothetical protein
VKFPLPERTNEVSVPFRLRTRARIGAHVIWDYLARPTAVAAEDIPWCAEAISPAWLTAVICGAHPGAAVETVTVVGGSDGSSVRRRLAITYNEAGRHEGLPAQIFAKATPGLLTRLTAGLVAPREGAFYRQIKPALNIETPQLYWTGADVVSGRSLHLFEDLTITKNASFCHANTAISRAQALDMVGLLAMLHGRFYRSPRFATDLAWLGNYADYVKTSAQNGAREFHDRAMLLAAPVVPADVMARREEIWPLLLAGMKASIEGPVTLLHSDVHLGNWYVTGEGRMGLCDWAIVCKGHWARDFAYAVSTSLAIADRRDWEQELLRNYLAIFHAQGGPLVAFDEGWRSYRQHLFGALLMWTPTLCHSPTRPDMQSEGTSLEMIQRITMAISDLAALDLRD